MYQTLKPTRPAATAPAGTIHTLGLQNDYKGSERRHAPDATQSGLFEAVTPGLIVGWLVRFWISILVIALLGALLGLASGALVKPRYTSYSDILLDPSNLRVVADDLYASNVQGDAQLLDVESKMRVLGSTNVLARVVRELGLENDPDLMEPDFSLFAAFLPADSSEDRFTTAMRALSERIRVRREERSYVVTASVWARSPERSAILTNAVVSAFLAELADAEAQGARNASAGLNQRLDELRADAELAEAAVANYRRDHGLQMTGTDQLSTQAAVQLNTQIATARESLIDAEARYASLTATSGEGALNAASLESTVLANMRTQYATTRQQVDSLSATLGPRHPGLTTARAQLASLEAEIDRETGRIVETARRDLERARSVFDQLNLAAGQQEAAVFSDDQSQLELRQLERAATAKVTIYEAYLERAQQIAERSELSTNNVRVISPAIAPLSRSYPPRTVLLIGMGFAGGAILAAFGVVLFNLLVMTKKSRAKPAGANAQ